MYKYAEVKANEYEKIRRFFITNPQPGDFKTVSDLLRKIDNGIPYNTPFRIEEIKDAERGNEMLVELDEAAPYIMEELKEIFGIRLRADDVRIIEVNSTVAATHKN